jgi:NAD(P)-dependent dehydrogenase (short-subunit alcohol dehydrogenase family)
MDKRLEGKVAIITGSSAGIGRASAELFAEKGARVIVSDSGRRPGLGEEAVRAIVTRGGEAAYCRCDVRDSAQIQALIDFGIQKFRRLDILMNNAWSGRIASVVGYDEKDWDNAVATSMRAAYLTCRAAIPHMIAGGGGSIINVSSIHGVLGARAYFPYSAVKAGLIGMVKQIAVDYGMQGIRANALLPGRIVTEGKVTFLEAHPEEYRRQKAVYPLGRPGTMQECAYAALFLASDESSFVTGHALAVDGGLTAELADTVAGPIEEGISEELAGRGIRWP